jgi:hypothetical protein
MDDGLRMVQSRACGAWTLPGDPTCAGVARRLFRMVASGLALEPDAVDDGVTMVSELAANTLHAQQGHPAPANPELWLYLRGRGPRAELVCKVFDSIPGWVRGHAPGRSIARAPAESMSGRGLEVVHALSAGRWGHHLSRARLTARALPQGPVRSSRQRARGRWCGWARGRAPSQEWCQRPCIRAPRAARCPAGTARARDWRARDAPAACAACWRQAR